jgi:hypothetical protein
MESRERQREGGINRIKRPHQAPGSGATSSDGDGGMRPHGVETESHLADQLVNVPTVYPNSTPI